MGSRKQVYVISDLHLGGEPGLNGSPGFQMSPARNQQRLARFIDELPRPSPDLTVHLVVAGDIVDFLAEKEFAAFTSDEGTALSKLHSIIERTQPVWDALRKFASDGGWLTLMLGNHDIELCLPAVRRELFAAVGHERVQFIYDNEAFTLGPILIEHGNRYDAWNAVPHGALRGACSRLSRRVSVGDFPAMPGSKLVADVMNPLKEEYSWIDLLKPENAGVLPILAALGAGHLSDIWRAAKTYMQTLEVEFGTEGEPADETFISGEAPSDIESSDQEMYDLAQDIASGGDATQVAGVMDWLQGARAAVGEAVREARRKALFRALRALASHHRLTFDTTIEKTTWLDAAQASADRGFQVIIYGHTHLVKKIQLKSPTDQQAVYLNSGTWADLMRIPEAVFGENEEQANEDLQQFVADLENDNVTHWRRFVPTYAFAELDGDELVHADAYFVNESGGEPESVTTEGMLARLKAEDGS